MRAIIDIFLAIIFSVIFTTGSIDLISNRLKVKSPQKVYDDKHSLKAYSKKLLE